MKTFYFICTGGIWWNGPLVMSCFSSSFFLTTSEVFQKFLHLFLLHTLASSQVKLLRNSFILNATMKKRECCKREILNLLFQSGSKLSRFQTMSCLLKSVPCCSDGGILAPASSVQTSSWRLKKCGTVLKTIAALSTPSEIYSPVMMLYIKLIGGRGSVYLAKTHRNWPDSQLYWVTVMFFSLGNTVKRVLHGSDLTSSEQITQQAITQKFTKLYIA